jgi:uncharacterized membrane protein
MLLPGQEAAAAIDQLFWRFSWLSAWHLQNLPLTMLFFNVVLLLAPYLALLGLEKMYKRKHFAPTDRLASGCLWLIFFIFFPNTAYLILDVRHLSGFCPPSTFLSCVQGIWVLPIFFLISLIGLISFVYLLSRLEKLLAKIWGQATATWLIIVYLPLVSLGVMLGLVERWNSWQAVVAPLKIMRSAVGYFSWGWRLLDWLIFTAFLFIVYYSGRWLLNSGYRVDCSKNKKF